MGGEWSRVGQLAGEAMDPAIGDVWVEKKLAEAPWPTGRATVTDTFPFTPADQPPRRVERVCLMYVSGARESLSIEELRKRFAFRQRAAQ